MSDDTGNANGEREELLRLRAENTRLQTALRRQTAASESRLQGIFDTAMDGVITVDADGLIVMFNTAAQEIFGCPQAQALGAPLEIFIPQRFRAGHVGLMRRFGTDHSAPRRMGALRVVTGLRRNGEEFPIDASISHTDTGGRQLFTVILRDVTERVRAEEALRESEAALRRLLAAQDKVQDTERRRISRELHDDLQQKLAAIKIDIAGLPGLLGRSVALVAPQLAEIDTLAAAAIASTRRIVSDLRPQLLEDLGLVAALEVLLEQFGRHSGVTCQLLATAEIGEQLMAHPLVETCLYRVAQEALNNVQKHARARTVKVELASAAAGQVSLRVRDDGAGMSPAQPRQQQSTGLIGMQERVRAMGGTLRVESTTGAGTIIEALVPMAAA